MADNRVTHERIEQVISLTQFFVIPNTTVTICCLTLDNGYTVIGESACINPDNFNAELGRGIALENAKEKIWALEGYLLKSKLKEQQHG